MTTRRCRLCRSTSHVITRCNDPRIQEIINDIETRLDDMQTKCVLFNYLNYLPIVEVAILAIHNGFKTTLPCRELIDLLIRAYTKKQRSCRIIWSNYIEDLIDRYPTFNLIDIFAKKFISMCKYAVRRNDGYIIGEIIEQTTEKFLSISDTQPANIRDNIVQGMINGITYIMETPNFADIKRKWCVGIDVDTTSNNPIIDEDCPICLESFQTETFMKTNCNHHFCYSCISKHLDTFKNKDAPHCAMCRGQIKSVLLFSENHIEEFTKKYTHSENVTHA